MIYEIFYLYFLYLLYNFIYSRYTIYNYVVLFFRDTLLLYKLIDFYNKYNKYIYEHYLFEKNNCIEIQYKNTKFEGFLKEIYQYNNELIFICKNTDCGIIISNYKTKKIIKKPKRKIKNLLYLATYKKLPLDVITYIGNYICLCHSCKNIPYSI